MSDVFISYSRLDRDFVAKLREALHAQNQEVWIDWESIPPSQAWWDEIKKGIARANNFVVVLSPNSMASPICHMEIEYARELKKRIIPVLHLAYDRDTALIAIGKRLADKDQEATRAIWGTRQPYSLFDANDSELKHINFFFFKNEDDFAPKFAELFAILRTDYAHKEKHTTVQLRANEWDKRNRDASFLLIDSELKDAQDWLVSASGKEPAPTDLQREYIAASEHRTRQLRNIRWASVIGSGLAVVALIFAVVASAVGVSATNQVANANATLTPIGVTLVSQNTMIANQIATAINAQAEAIAAQNTAAVNVTYAAQRVNDANATLTPIPVTLAYISTQVQNGVNQSESLRLAAAANTVLQDNTSDKQVAVLLAIRALKSSYTSQADVGLMQALDAPYAKRAFIGHTGAVNSVAFSPDGRYALTGSDDQTARLWDVQSGQTVRTFVGHTSYVNSVAFSPDGRYALTGSGDHTARLWDIQTGQTVHTFPGHTGQVTSVAFSPDGRYALTGSDDQTARLWDVQSEQTVRIFSGHTDTVESVVFSPDGRYALTGSHDTTARLWDVDYRDFANQACTHVWRDFTAAERAQFNIQDSQPTCPQFGVSSTTPNAGLPPTTTELPRVLPVWTRLPTLTPSETATFTPIVPLELPTLAPSAIPTVTDTDAPITPSPMVTDIGVPITPSPTVTVAITPVYTQVTTTPLATATSGNTPTITLTPTPSPTMSDTPGPSPTLAISPHAPLPEWTPIASPNDHGYTG